LLAFVLFGMTPTTAHASQVSNPYTVTVSADTTRYTGIRVKPGYQISFAYLYGTWTDDFVHHSDFEASGISYVCADYSDHCDEVIPDYNRGALIGFIGDQELRIGNYGNFYANNYGTIILEMNDTPERWDNKGRVTIQITVTPCYPSSS
jgi:hypothetical protein